ncbi:MAG TPA: PIG-L family deacetylase [Acidimicrobiales bacterium]|nr:PIG-L family deacetylase [Acidimicrobiales bacterium]
MSATGLGTVLGVWAHPDDECYLMAGTALVAAAAGSYVACITATAGEAGATSDDDRWPRSRLASIRTQELGASLAVLGITDHTWLGLPDGGLASVDLASGVALIAEAVDRVRPDTVLTFGPDGMTGHPDHMAVGDWAERAVTEVMGDRCRVLAATKTPGWAEAFAAVNADVFESGPPCTPPDKLALEVRLSDDVLDRKLRALAAQLSQTAALAAWMGPATYRAWVAEEYWVRR